MGYSCENEPTYFLKKNGYPTLSRKKRCNQQISNILMSEYRTALLKTKQKNEEFCTLKLTFPKQFKLNLPLCLVIWHTAHATLSKIPEMVSSAILWQWNKVQIVISQTYSEKKVLLDITPKFSNCVCFLYVNFNLFFKIFSYLRIFDC